MHSPLRCLQPTDSEPSSGREDAWLQQQQQEGSDSPDSPTTGAADGSRPSQPALQREDWMTVPMARSFAGQPDKPADKPKEKEVCNSTSTAVGSV